MMYRNSRAIVQTTKLARLRGKRMRISRPTKGSRIKAITTAVIDVMKNTRPKYRIAMIAAIAITGMARFRAAGTVSLVW